MTHRTDSESNLRRGRGLRAAAMAVVATAGLALAPALAEAAPAKPTKPAACYNRKEHAAEQLMRMHTELMVMGLTCDSIFPEYKTFAKYQEFTVKNRKMLSEAEATLIGHFQRTGGGGTAKFDTYRTELANQISRRVGVIGSWSYCQQLIPRSTTAVSLQPDDLRVLTSNEKEAGVMHLGARPLCDVKVASLPDPVGGVAPPRGKAQPTKAVAAKPAAGKPAVAAKPVAGKPAAAKPAAGKPPVKNASKPVKVATR